MTTAHALTINKQAYSVAVEASDTLLDVRGSADFRGELVRVLTHRAVATACNRARSHSNEQPMVSVVPDHV